jgi:hypothetical protein
MLRQTSTFLFASAVALCTGGELFAQAFGSGSSGPGGGLGGMSMGGGAGGGGSGASGSAAFSSSGTAFSSSGGGAGAFGNPGAGFALNSSGFSGGSSTPGASGMVGMTAGGMYGATGSGVRSTVGGVGSSGTQGGSRQSSSTTAGRGGTQTGGGTRGRQTSSRGGQTNSNGSAAGAAARQQAFFEPRIEVGIEIAPQNTSVVSTRVTSSFHSKNLTGRFGGVQVVVEGDVAVLRGTVNSGGDRQLAEQFALLEPSITSVRNETTVKAPAATAARPISTPSP